MSSRHRATGRFSPALVPSGRMIVLLAAVLCAILTAACSPGRIEPDSRPSRENGGRSEVSLASLEGLAFVRDGSVWTVSDGEARRVVESNGIRSLRANRTGDSVTWIETDGTRAIVMAALTSDWRPEPVWESELGSLISEAVHDDVTDTVWFSVSGEATTTIGVVERLTRAAPREVRLPVEVATAIALAPADGALFVVSATQEPATLLKAGDPPDPIVDVARLFSPRVSSDGRFVAATGALRPEDGIQLLLVDLARGTARALAAGRGVPSDPAWSPSGDVIAFRDSLTQTVWTLDVDSDEAKDTGVRADEGGLAW